MAMTLAQIRAKIKEQEEKKGGQSGSFGDGSIFPHWNIPEGSQTRVRFLPDADPSNDYFWVERNMIKLPFPGILGDPNSKPVIVQVPCIEMWPDMGVCPILAEVRPWFKAKDKTLEDMGRKYWKKKSYLMQGFVHENPLKEDNLPENPIRRFIISPQIYNIIKAALMDPELENLPTDFQVGLDFTVKKTSKGGYADYSTSTWARKETALTAEELEAIETHKLFDLKSFLPKRPSAEELVIMKEMFDASVDGQPYDPNKWEKYFKPVGYQSKDDAEADASPTVAAAAATVAKSKTTAKVAPPVVEDDDDTPAADTPVVKPAATGSRAEDILAMIKNRQKKA